MPNSFFSLQNRTRPESIRVTKTELRFGPLSVERANTVPAMEYGRPGDVVIIDNTDVPGPESQINLTPTSVGIWIKQPQSYSDSPQGNVVVGFPGGSAEAGDVIEINGSNVTLTSPYTATQAVADIVAASIPGITAVLLGEAVEVREISGNAITINDVSGNPSESLGLYSQPSLSDTGADGAWVPIRGSGSSGPIGAPDNASYVTISAEPNLSDERTLVAGSGLSLTDGGPNSSVTISTNITGASPVAEGAALNDEVLIHNTSTGQNEKIDISEIIALTGVIEHVWHVAENGNDVTGNGSDALPYATIKQALSVSNPGDVVIVYPGSYTEANPLTISSGVSVVGVGGPADVVVTPNTPTSNLFVSAGGSTTIRDLTMSGVTGASAVVRSNPGPALRLDAVRFENCQICIDVSGNAIVFVNNVLFQAGTYTDLISITSGTLIVYDSTVPPNVTASTIVNANGPNVNANLSGNSFRSANVTRLFDIDGGAQFRVFSGRIEAAANGARINGASTFYAVGVSFINVTNNQIEVLDTDSRVFGSSLLLDRSKISFPGAYRNDVISFLDIQDGDEGFQNWGNLAVGRPCHGRYTRLGEGPSYTQYMRVFTTDDTATPTTDGAGFADVSAAASSASGSTFSFQGTTANHTILIGSNHNDGVDLIKHWGLDVLQTVAAVENTPKSFAFEIWDGSAWVDIAVMATETTRFYRYANEVFLRANSDENIRYEATSNTTWVKKSINGLNLYWSRIRITDDLVTAPVFQQFKIHSSYTEMAPDGSTTYHGNSRFRKSIVATGNIYGETGGVQDGNIPVGSGGEPTGWTHNVKNSVLNNDGDAIYFQTVIPNGIDTSLPIRVRVIYSVSNTGVSVDGSIIVSMLPLEVRGVLVADPTGGIAPVPRTQANTSTLTNTAAQVASQSIPLTDTTRLQLASINNFDISDYYEEDLLAFRIELDDDGDNKDIVIWSVEISAGFWIHGSKL